MNFKRFKTLLAFFGIYIVWGTTFLAISIGVKGFPPFLLSGVRFLAAGILLFIFSLVKGESSGSLHNWKKNAIIGLLILTGGTGLLTWAEQYISSSEACTIEACGPFLFIALDRQNWQFHFSKKLIVTGLIIGFCGVVVFLRGSLAHGTSTDHPLKILSVLVIIISLVCWVAGSLLSKKLAPTNSLGMNTAQQLLSAGTACFFISLGRRETAGFHPSAVSSTVWLSILYLILFGSIIAYISYQYLLSTQNPSVVSTHTYVNPIVAVIAGWLLAGEKINIIQLSGLLIILAGVFLTNVGNYTFKRGSWFNRISVRLRSDKEAGHFKLRRFFNRYKKPTYLT